MNIFSQCALQFVADTVTIRRCYGSVVLFMDSFSGHLSFSALSLFKQNNITVIGLPAHSIHPLQPLDYSFFSPFKASIRQHVNERAVHSSKHTVDDINALCEIVKDSLVQASSKRVIKSGFTGTGLWSDEKKGCDPWAIREKDISTFVRQGEQPKAFGDYLDLMEKYKNRKTEWKSDNLVMRNGTINTTKGAVLTESYVLGVFLKGMKSGRLQKLRSN